MKKMSLKNITMLFLTAFIWGVAFVAQSVGMNYIGPFTFSCVRSILGGIVLIPCIWFLDRLKMKEEGVTEKRTMSEKEKKTLLIGGICCGIALCVASNLQQFGVKYTTVGKAGFITALYIVLVPMPKLDTSTNAIIAQRSSAMPKMPNNSSHGTTVSAAHFLRIHGKSSISWSSTAHSTAICFFIWYTPSSI